jgi:hypothetical protein
MKVVSVMQKSRAVGGHIDASEMGQCNIFLFSYLWADSNFAITKPFKGFSSPGLLSRLGLASRPARRDC